MAFPKGYYGDPLKRLLDEEAKTCKGCAFEESVKLFGGVSMRYCSKGKKHGKRCKGYQER